MVCFVACVCGLIEMVDRCEFNNTDMPNLRISDNETGKFEAVVVETKDAVCGYLAFLVDLYPNHTDFG